VKAKNRAPLRGTWAAGMPSSGTWPIYGNDEGFRSFAFAGAIAVSLGYSMIFLDALRIFLVKLFFVDHELVTL